MAAAGRNQSLGADEMLEVACAQVLEVLGDDVVGIYLFGSLATGDFDDGVSDIDLLVVTTGNLSKPQQTELESLHQRLTVQQPEWNDRIEVIYLGAEALRTFRTKRSALSVTSPGEPFHTTDAGREWLVNWFNIQQTGRTLHGPDPRTVIPAITVAEVREELQAQVQGWRARVRANTAPGSLAYAVLTVGRAWDTITHGTVRSKLESAAWVKQQLPQWGQLIDRAVRVRASRGREGGIDADEAARFVNDVARSAGLGPTTSDP